MSWRLLMIVLCVGYATAVFRSFAKTVHLKEGGTEYVLENLGSHDDMSYRITCDSCGAFILEEKDVAAFVNGTNFGWVAKYSRPSVQGSVHVTPFSVPYNVFLGVRVLPAAPLYAKEGDVSYSFVVTTRRFGRRMSEHLIIIGVAGLLIFSVAAITLYLWAQVRMRRRDLDNSYQRLEEPAPPTYSTQQPTTTSNIYPSAYQQEPAYQQQPDQQVQIYVNDKPGHE